MAFTMNQSTSYASAARAERAAPASNMLRELVAAMPIVVLYKAVRTAWVRH